MIDYDGDAGAAIGAVKACKPRHLIGAHDRRGHEKAGHPRLRQSLSFP
jgi:hypothetical protein